MNTFKEPRKRMVDALIALALGALAAVLYFASLADYAFPGESAHLLALWRGLDTAANPPYPLMAVFAKAFGAGNALAPVCGILAVMALYALVTFFFRERIRGELTAAHDTSLARIAGVSAALVFMLTPSVRSAATHLEPRIFEAAWALVAALAVMFAARAPKPVALLLALVAGALSGFGLVDSVLFAALSPLFLLAIVAVALKRGEKPYLPITLYVLAFLAAFFAGVWLFQADIAELLKGLAREGRNWMRPKGWIFVLIFSTLPFAAVLFSSDKTYNEKPGLVAWTCQSALTIVAILAVATPLSPSSLLAPYGILPVVTSAFAAVVAGHLVSYWWANRRAVPALVAGGILAFVLVVTLLWNLFRFDGARGAFADRFARRILDDLGTRTWLVTDGLLDDHLMLAAAETGRELNLVALHRDLDELYVKRLEKLVENRKLGGSRSGELKLSLALGVLPFVQDWLRCDPSVGKEVAIFGAPDLWYGAGLKSVPELLFFGADPARKPDWSAWKEFDKLLYAPKKGWGSYRLGDEDDPVARMRLSLRRHLGHVANDRGVYLQDAKRDDEAFAMYELVLGEIDADNVCALFNEVEMAGAKHPKALAKKAVLERTLNRIVGDKKRRYILWRLGNYYGYIRNPDAFVRLGFTWARSGRPGDALAQIRRAIDFVPTDKRSVLLNMMASLYANENDRAKSRQIFETILRRDAKDHDALVGLMRLELEAGHSEKALEYLEKAAAGSEGHAGLVERAMVALMKNDYAAARAALKKATDAKPDDLQAWSLLAATILQQFESEKDEKRRAALRKEIENDILPSMEKRADGPFDYYVQTTKAFLLLQQGEEKRREARDAFINASQARPGVTATEDMVLGLDISIDDKVDAERRAREVLRRNRNAPLANYVMGSLALGKEDYEKAEAYLLKAVNGPRPNALALNDLAEVFRRKGDFVQGEHYARKCVEAAPTLYVAWETLGMIILASKGDLAEAERCVQKALDLSKAKNGREGDVRMLVSLARVQLAKGDKTHAKISLRKVSERLKDLTPYERKDYDDLLSRTR